MENETDDLGRRIGRLEIMVEALITAQQLEIDETAGVPRLKTHESHPENGARFAVDLPAGIGQLIVTIPTEGDGFDVTWRSHDKVRVKHRFLYADGDKHQERPRIDTSALRAAVAELPDDRDRGAIRHVDVTVTPSPMTALERRVARRLARNERMGRRRS